MSCSTTRITDPTRTATEQLLLSTAADRALRSANLEIFADKKVYLDSTFFDSYDSKYALGTIRDALSRAGALLISEPTNSDIIVEARSGALSTDGSSTLFGIPNMGLPIPLAGAIQIPEVALYKSQKQHSVAKIALLAFASKSREHVYSSGSLVGKSYNNYYKCLGFISIDSTDIPEKQKHKKSAREYQSWFPEYTESVTNVVLTNSPVDMSSTNDNPSK